MSTFLYSPGIKVYIATQKHGNLDVSDDLVNGTMVRRSDGVSTFDFGLLNQRRKYDLVFAPNDRIVVMMKRLTWLRTFTGYLNSVPLVTAWPRTVSLSASCSLKRLQYWYWDPGAEASQDMINQAFQTAQGSDDGGTTNAVLSILDKVVNWPAERVHIAGIPPDWFDFAYKIAQDVKAQTAEADKIAQEFYGILGGGGSVGGQVGGGDVVPNGTLKPGRYGGVTLNKNQVYNAELIYNVGKQTSGISNRDIVIALMAAMQESSLINTKGGDRDSAGLFQMRPSMGWGTYAQVTNPTYAARKFFSVLKGVKGRNKMTPTQAAQAVERSGTPGAYARWQSMAQQIVNTLASKSSKGVANTSLGNDPGFQNNTKNNGKANAATYASNALNAVKKWPHVYYLWGGDNPSAKSLPRVDCSGFVRWVYYQTLGSLKGMPRTSQAQSSWCKAHGKIVSAKTGMNTAGALMFRGGVGAAHHVEISVGDGKHTVGAHHTGAYVSEISTSASYWTNAGILPNLVYDGTVVGSTGGTGQDTSSADQPKIVPTPYKQAASYNSNDKFDQLFGDSPWVGEYSVTDAAESNALAGIRALLNDQPLLPYLKNLFNGTMRSFCSAPNGDLIAWFPDYYGIWGTAAAMQIEPIEIQDFNVTWSDDFFVTHQFTVTPPAQNVVELDTGNVQGIGITPLQTVTTQGIASIDIPSIMYALFGLEPTTDAAKNFIDYIYSKFGARPDFQQLPGITGPKGEFFSALFLFMRQWAYQYNADIPITFMPELWPGMLVKVPAFDFQAYVTTVTHSFSFGEGGGFETTINIAAPARLPKSDNDRTGALIGLPVAGGLDPTTVKKTTTKE